MYRSFEEVWKFSEDFKVCRRDAAMAVSLRRLQKAMTLRGQAW
jgi:glutamate dehydrogenase/leucine dehydrogenase